MTNLINVDVGFGVNGVGEASELRDFLQLGRQRIGVFLFSTRRSQGLRTARA